MPARRVGGGDLRVVAVDVAVAERVAGLRLVRLVRPEQVHPQEKRVIVGRGLQVVGDLAHAALAFRELDLGELEPELLLLEAGRSAPGSMKNTAGG